MRSWCWMFMVAAMCMASCHAQRAVPDAGQAMTPAERMAVEESVRGFMARVSQEVTTEGPTAWSKEFESGPNFFMASEGKLAYASGEAAAKAIPDLPKMIKKIALRWENDLRVDVLTPNLAVVGTTYQEVRESPDGEETTENGYFTGVAEQQGGEWRFRDAHWSVVPPEPKKP
ncbi:MAG TPA: hypothetical protein VMH20_18845 [Verrucomicrobiae bacterium]|nr:hypothetical protein [Verrucomicrobiae bacterium]